MKHPEVPVDPIGCPTCGGEAWLTSSGEFPDGDTWYECDNGHHTTIEDYLASVAAK